MLEGRTIASLAADLSTGKTTSRALVEAALESIARGGSAFTFVAAERARAEADASAAARARNVVASPLAGIPISVKDLFDVAGETTTAGSIILREAAPASADAPTIARLRKAGAVIVGRTHMSEFAFTGLGLNPHYPVCANPRDGSRVPGGSSSGAAVSVARGQAAMGLGTDTGGSTRIPAAFCGLVGFKPTQSRITRAGAYPLSLSLDSIGPIANSVSCCRLVDAIIADVKPPRHEAVAVRGLRFAVPLDFVVDDLDATVAAAFERALRALALAGAQIEHISVPAFARLPELTARGPLAGAEAYLHHSAAGLLQQRAQYDPNVLVRIEERGRAAAAHIGDIVAARATLIRESAAASAGFDAMLMPAVPIVAPRIADVSAAAAFATANALALRNTSLINLLDRCALSVPMQREGELPSGLMIVGEHLGDARLFAVGEAVEAVFNLSLSSRS
ncbi:MAG: amidase [Alphaproteobacteria bacterium]|nr:amidase [Alphaproteobacteria bacterium]